MTLVLQDAHIRCHFYRSNENLVQVEITFFLRIASQGRLVILVRTSLFSSCSAEHCVSQKKNTTLRLVWHADLKIVSCSPQVMKHVLQTPCSPSLVELLLCPEMSEVSVPARACGMQMQFQKE